MPYPERLLGDGEEVVAELPPHWVYLGWPLVSVVASVTLSVGVIVAFPFAPFALLWVLVALVGGTLLWLAARWTRRRATSVVLTSARVVRRSGIVSRTTFEIRLERISELSCYQSLGERVLGTGAVLIGVPGEPRYMMLDHLSHPVVVQSLISEQVSKWHRDVRAPAPRYPRPSDDTPRPRRPTTPSFGGSDDTARLRLPDDRPRRRHPEDTPPTGTPLATYLEAECAGAASRLVQLDELRRRGIISAQEYESKKEQLLREL